MLALCKTVAEELAVDGIRVNCIAPGVIKTKFSRAVIIIKFKFDKKNKISLICIYVLNNSFRCMKQRMQKMLPFQ